METGKEIESITASDDRTNESVNCADFSPDGRQVLSAADDQTARLWDVETGKELHRLVGVADPVAALAFAADGRAILMVSRTGMSWRMDAEGGKALPSFVATTKENAPPAAASMTDPRFRCRQKSAMGDMCLSWFFLRTAARSLWDIFTASRVYGMWRRANRFNVSISMMPDLFLPRIFLRMDASC